MIYALSNGSRLKATPGEQAQCPACGDGVVAKCGSIKVWHWAHKQNECDPWSEGMTEWHMTWQQHFPSDWNEVVIRRDGVFHRADVYLPSGRVVEFQHSSIGVDEIGERERFYQNMLWVFDVRGAYTNDRLLIRNRNTHCTFRWKHPRISIARATCTVYLHYSQHALLRLGGMYEDAPCGGWGWQVGVTEFISGLVKAVPA